MVNSERKTAFITGSASGIGLETTRRFAQDPRYNPIYAIDRDPKLQTIFSQHEYPSITLVQLDVIDQEGVPDLLKRIVRETGHLDVVVNAAGVMVKAGPKTWWGDHKEQSYPELEEMNEINVRVPVRIAMGAAEIMKGRGGVIINVTSAKYLFPDIYHVSYHLGKENLSRFTRGLAKIYQQQGIRVVDVQPGNTKTDIDRGDWIKTEETEANVSQIVADWWRDHFGNDPKNVAEVIYKIAEGKVRGKIVPVGIDAKVGRFLNFATYPLAGYGWDFMFFVGSTIFYQLATLGNKLRIRLKNQ